MTTETAATPYSLTLGYEQLDGPPNGSASEALTIAHAQLHIMLTDSRADSDLCEYGEYVDRLLWTVELFDLPADATVATLTGLLLDPEYAASQRNEVQAEPYDLLACLVETMRVLGIVDTDTLTEYVEAIVNQMSTDMLADYPSDRKLRPGLLDSTILSGPQTLAIN
jgi:hypothetical protein